MAHGTARCRNHRLPAPAGQLLIASFPARHRLFPLRVLRGKWLGAASAAAPGGPSGLVGKNHAGYNSRAMEAVSLKPLWKRIWQAPVATLLPRLIVIGAQKAGTTALTKYLAQHPRFLPSRVKEISYFGCPPCYSKGPRWYA